MRTHAILTILAFAGGHAVYAQVGRNQDWPMAGGDSARTGVARPDSRINKDSAKEFTLLYKVKLEDAARGQRSLTPPAILGLLISYRGFKELGYVGGNNNGIYTLNVDAGRMFWAKPLIYSSEQPQAKDNALPCSGSMTAMAALVPQAGGFGGGRGGRGAPPPAAGAPATPPVVRGPGLGGSGGFGGTRPVVALASDGRLHKLNTANGDEFGPPLAFLPANGKASALNLADNVVYTSTNQGCGSVPNAIWAIDTAAEGGTRIRSFPTNGGGVWGAGGVTIGLDGTIFAQVGDGPSDPIANKWSNTLLALSAKDLEMKQYFTPPSTPSAGKNVGLSAATPVAFAFKGRNVVLASAKDGRLYLLDGQLVGGEDHRTFLARTPVLSDGAAADRGVYAMSTYEDEQQTRWILAAVWGPLGAEVKVAGAQPAPTGSIVAFKVEEQGGVPAMTPAWVSRDMPAPAAPVISSGVVFALSAGEYTRTAKENWGGMYMVDERPKPLAHATLYALDGATGKEIYSSRNTITAPAALTGLSVANGRAYFGGTDGVLYCFGIPMER